MNYFTAKIKKYKSRISTLESKSYFLVYTLLFAFVILITFSWYILSQKTFIWQYDGWWQHYKALVYYAKYLRSIIQNLFLHHQLVIPSYDFSLGEGSDILAVLHYYVIGDPFSVLSIFVPVRFMYLYYNAMIVLRLYLSGIAFSWLCFQTGQKNKYAVMTGSMVYVFCYWAILNAVRHPYFLNPMIYLPLLIIGVEKILKKERPYLFIVTVLLSAVSNFYFFYVLVLITIIYVIARLLATYHNNIKLAFQILFQIGLASILGLLLAGIILLPICYIFLNDTRMSTAHTLHLFYPLSYYSKLPALFIVPDELYWMCMGFAAPVLPAVFLLFRKHKKYGLLKIFFIICIIISMIPALGQILNAFSYTSNKWCWALALLSAYILTTMWPYLMNLNLKDSIFLFCCITGYFLVCILFEYSRTSSAFTAIILAFIFLIILLPFKEGEYNLNYKTKQCLALTVVLISIFSNSFWQNSASGNDYASGVKESRFVADDLYANEASIIKGITASNHPNTFYRYSGRNLTRNAGLLAGASSTQYYWSLSNPYLNEFRTATEQLENGTFTYTGYDDRASLITLASVLYYAVPAWDSSPVPYGFTYFDTVNAKESVTQNAIAALKSELQLEELTDYQLKMIEDATHLKYKIYHNEYALPFAYTYENSISRDVWNTFSAVEKQETLLQAIVLEDYNTVSNTSTLNLSSTNINYNLTCNGGGISLKDNAFVVTSANSTVTLTFEGLPNSETYFSIKGLSFENIPQYDLYWGNENTDPLNLYNKVNWDLLSHSEKEALLKDKIFWSTPTSTTLTLKSSSGVSKALTYYTEAFSWYDDRHDFTANLDYSEDAVTSITITFSKIGIYTFDSINITCYPFNNYVDQINTLSKNSLEDIQFDTDTITGTVTLDTAKFLCLTIPYSKGWHAYVDGKKAELFQANVSYMALALDAGKHNIKLVYSTPLQKSGIAVSSIATVILIIFVIFLEHKKRN